MTSLITVPNFHFSQGDPLDDVEMPITVCYYKNADRILIEFQQENEYISFTSFSELKELVRQVEHHLPEATKHLKGQ